MKSRSQAQDRKPPRLLAVGVFILDRAKRTVQGPRGKARLTPKQADLLALLMRYPEQLISRETIMREVWHTTYYGDMRTLDVHISWLRKNIEPDPSDPAFIFTKRGIGYVLYPNGVQSGENGSSLP